MGRWRLLTSFLVVFALVGTVVARAPASAQVNGPPVATADRYELVEDTTLDVAAPGVLVADSDPDGDPLSAELVTGPSFAAAFDLQADGSFTYTPVTDYYGADAFTYRASDGQATSAETTVNLGIEPVNDPPSVTAPTSLTVAAGEDVRIAVSTDDVDADDDGDTFPFDDGITPAFRVSVEEHSTVGPGTLSVGELNGIDVTGNGTDDVTGVGEISRIQASLDALLYAAPAEPGTVTLRLAVGDNGENGAALEARTTTAEIVVTVVPANGLPVAVDDEVTTVAGVPVALDLLANDTDPDDDPLVIATLDQPARGTVAADGSTYTPEAGFVGTDTFTYTVTDGNDESAAATVTVTVAPGGLTVNTTDDVSDIDPGDGVCWIGGLLPDGRARCSLRAAIEEANALAGPDTITIEPGSYEWGAEIVVDGSVELVAQPPLFVRPELGDTFRMLPTSSMAFSRMRITGNLTATGVEVGPVRIVDSELESPDNSVLAVPASLLRIERSSVVGPNTNGVGLGGQERIELADVTGHHVVVSGAPTVVVERSSFTGNTQLSNIDDLTIVESLFATDFRAVLLFAGQVASISNSTLDTPRPVEMRGGFVDIGYSTLVGTQWAIRLVGDGAADASNSVLVGGLGSACLGAVTVTSVVADDTSCGSGPLSGVDPLLGPLQDNGGPTLTRAPLVGSPVADAATGACPASDQRGQLRPFDADGDGTPVCDIGAVESQSLLTPPNQAPTLVVDPTSVTVAEDGSATITATVDDPDGSADDVTVTAVVVDDTLASAEVTGTSSIRTITITGLADANGASLVQVGAGDGTDTVLEIVSLTVTPVNDAPVLGIIPDQVLGAGESVVIEVPVSDVDDPPAALTVSAVSDDTSLVTSDTAGLDLTLTAAVGDGGTTEVTVSVTDGELTVATTFEVTVLPGNRPPVGVADTYATPEDTVLAIAAPGVLGNDDDADGDDLTAVFWSDPANGAVEGQADGSFTYAPDPDFAGTDTFTYVPFDGETAADPVIVTIIVDGIDDPPSIAPIDDVTTPEDTPTSVAIDVTDPDTPAGDLVLTAAAVPAGVVSVGVSADGSSVLIAPEPDLAGVATVNVTVSDGTTTVEATFTVTVEPVNDPPTIDAPTAATSVDGADAAIAVAVDDVETPAGDLLVTAAVADGSLGTVTVGGPGPDGAAIVTFTPAPGAQGSTEIEISVSDGELSSSTTVALDVTSANRPPVGLADDYTVAAGAALVVEASGVLGNDTDADADALTATSWTEGAQGVVVGQADGSFTYTPDAGFFGTDTFTYVPFDGELAGDPVTVTVEVTLEDAGLEINTTDDGSDTDPGDGVCWTGGFLTDGTPACSLRAAIEETNALPGPDELAVPAGLYVADDELPLVVGDDITLVGEGEASTSIRASVVSDGRPTSLGLRALSIRAQSPDGGSLEPVIVSLIDVRLAAGSAFLNVAGFDVESSVLEGGALIAAAGSPEASSVRDSQIIAAGLRADVLEVAGTTGAANLSARSRLSVVDSRFVGYVIATPTASDDAVVSIVRTELRVRDTVTSSLFVRPGSTWTIDESYVELDTLNSIRGGLRAADSSLFASGETGFMPLNDGANLELVRSLVAKDPSSSTNWDELRISVAGSATMRIHNATVVGEITASSGADIELRHATIDGQVSAGSGSAAMWSSYVGSCGALGGFGPVEASISSDGDCGIGFTVVSDPLLGPLQDNGGPTATIAPRAGSPLLDAASGPDCPAVDQRGEPRPFDADGDGIATCDIGAVEVQEVVDVPTAPVVGLTGPSSVPVGVETMYTLTIDDPDPGEVHTATVDWGDGPVDLGSVVDGQELTNAFDDEGSFVVTVEVIDSDGLVGTATLEVVAVRAGLEINTTDDGPDTDAGDGLCWTGAFLEDGTPACSLRAAVEETNALPGTDELTVPDGAYAGADPVSVADDLTLVGGGADRTIIELTLEAGVAGPAPSVRFEALAFATFLSGDGIQLEVADGVVGNVDRAPGASGGATTDIVDSTLTERLRVDGLSLTDVDVDGVVQIEATGDVTAVGSTLDPVSIEAGGAVVLQSTIVDRAGPTAVEGVSVTADDSTVIGGANAVRADEVVLRSSTVTSGLRAVEANAVVVEHSTVRTLESTFDPRAIVLTGSNPSLEVTNATIVSPAIALDVGASATVALRHATILGNVSGGGAVTVDAVATVFDGSCAPALDIDTVGSAGVDGSCVREPLGAVDVVLEPLADNGGTGLTARPDAGSPLIDAAPAATCPDDDQRGRPRPVDGDGNGVGDCDIGAVEVQEMPIPTLSVVGAVAREGDPGDTPGSLGSVLLGGPQDVTVTIRVEPVFGDPVLGDACTAGVDVATRTEFDLVVSPGTTDLPILVCPDDDIEVPSSRLRIEISLASGGDLVDDELVVLDDDLVTFVGPVTIVEPDLRVGDGPLPPVPGGLALAPDNQTVQWAYERAPWAPSGAAVVLPGSWTPCDPLSGLGDLLPIGITQQGLTGTVTALICGDVVPEPSPIVFRLAWVDEDGVVADVTEVSLRDNDAPPSLTGVDTTVPEPPSVPATAAVTFTLDQPLAVPYQAVALVQSVAGGAIVGPQGSGCAGDVQSSAELITIPAGVTAFDVDVTICPDGFLDPDGPFVVAVRSPLPLVPDLATAVVTIDPDPGQPPTIALEDLEVVEGDSAFGASATTGTLSLVVLDAPAFPTTVTVRPDGRGTANVGIAPCGTPLQDVATWSVDVLIDPDTEGQTYQVAAPVACADDVEEVDEWYGIEAVLADGELLTSAEVTIRDDDATIPVVTVADASVIEGDDGTVVAEVEVTVIGGSAPVPVVWSAVPLPGGDPRQPASVGSDFVSSSGNPLLFPPGGDTQTVQVVVVGDELAEGDEYFRITVSAPGAFVLDGTGIVAIEDDDQRRVSVSDAAPVLEGDGGTRTMSFVVSLESPVAEQVQVRASTNGIGGTTVPPDDPNVATGFGPDRDFDATSATLTFNPGGPTSLPFEVLVRGDEVIEPDERVYVVLEVVTGNAPVVLGDAVGRGEILNDDQLSIRPDETPPEFQGVADIDVVLPPRASTAPVSWQIRAVDDIDGLLGATCDPPSGSSFGLGDTLVSCTSADAAGNEATTSFFVRVRSAEGNTLRNGAGAPALSTVPGETLRLRAGGFATASTAFVQLRSEPVDLAVATANRRGRVDVEVTIPDATELGAHSIVALGIDPDGRPIQVVFPISVVDPPVCTIVGTDGPDLLIGTSGPDVICGLDGPDLIFGLGGDDLVFAGRGADWVSGGAGDDHIRGERGADILFGNRGADLLAGGGGTDVLWGNRGDDELYGGPGADLLYGGPGADVLDGGPGRDSAFP